MENPIAHLQIETNTGTFKFEITPNDQGYRVDLVLPEKLTLSTKSESLVESLEIITHFLFTNEIEILN